jgi:hypothetical protein
VWSFQVGTGIVAPPITWEQDGEQYIAVATGWGGAVPLWGGDVAKKVLPESGRLDVGVQAAQVIRGRTNAGTTACIGSCAVSMTAARKLFRTRASDASAGHGSLAGSQGRLFFACDLPPDLRVSLP